jgi:uncharacterized protein
MNKWLFWGVLALVGFWVWKIHEGKKKRQAERRDDPATPPPETAVALVLSCAHCGLHIPKEEALEKNGEWFCSRQHALAGPRT